MIGGVGVGSAFGSFRSYPIHGLLHLRGGGGGGTLRGRGQKPLFFLGREMVGWATIYWVSPRESERVMRWGKRGVVCVSFRGFCVSCLRVFFWFVDSREKDNERGSKKSNGILYTGWLQDLKKKKKNQVKTYIVWTKGWVEVFNFHRLFPLPFPQFCVDYGMG